jgi:hypothetical protein
VDRVIADRGGRFWVDAHGKTSREVVFRTISCVRAGSIRARQSSGWLMATTAHFPHPDALDPYGLPRFPAAKFGSGNPALTIGGLW